MKLNIGCGKIYINGYINIDAFDRTIADKIMPAHQLDFKNNSVDEIQIIQLIEHLGLFGSTLALSEWFRVLKPEGKLVIETPDVENSFKKFLEGGIEQKKTLLNWIYGLETEGMGHKLCFSEVLLEDLLKRSGFVELKKTNFEKEKNNPTLRIECKKTNKTKIYDIISSFRKRLVSEKKLKKNDYLLSLKQEELFDIFISKLKEFEKKNNVEAINEIIVEGSIKDVEITKILIEECINSKLVQKEKLKKQIDSLNYLKEIDFQKIQLNILKESELEPGTQNNVYQTILTFSKEIIKKLLSEGNESTQIKKSLKDLSETIKSKDKLFFSYELIEKKAAEISCIGSKDFIKKNYSKAIKLFSEAITLDRNHIVYFWNLARLNSLTGDFNESEKNYKRALKLVKIFDHKKKDELIKKIKKEITEIKEKRYNKPITKNDF